MRKSVQSFSIKVRQLFTRKAVAKHTDAEKLRYSARSVLRKYHKTFRRLAHE